MIGPTSRLHLRPDGSHNWRSGVLHIAPSSPAGGSLRQAVRASGRSDHVLAFSDDLSCGPIDSDDASARSAWWATICDEHQGADHGTDFWNQLTSTTDRLVVWFGRHSALEHAFFLAVADRLGERPYDIVDVTGLQLPATQPGGLPGSSHPRQSVSLIAPDDLVSLFGMARPIKAQEREEAARRWRELKSENAPFRIVTATGLVSAPAETFDRLLLERTTMDWRRVVRVIGDTLGCTMDPYIQTGDLMLLTRVVALVAAGKLVADSDPWNMRRCHVRLPDRVGD